MPIFYRDNEDFLDEQKEKLGTIFNSVVQSMQMDNDTRQKIKHSIECIDTHFLLAYEHAKNTDLKSIDKILTNYERCVTILSDLRDSTISLSHANKEFEKIISNVNFDHYFKKNLFLIAKMVFWTAAFTSLSAAMLLVALPMLVVPNVFGIATAVAISGMMLNCVYQSIQCAKELTIRTPPESKAIHAAIDLVGLFAKDNLNKSDSDVEDENSSELAFGS